MWVLVLDGPSGTVIKNASFSLAFYNRGDGYYYVNFTAWDEAFLCSAPQHQTLWATDDYYNGFTAWLARSQPPPPPPPPPPPGCWS